VVGYYFSRLLNRILLSCGDSIEDVGYDLIVSLCTGGHIIGSPSIDFVSFYEKWSYIVMLQLAAFIEHSAYEIIALSGKRVNLHGTGSYHGAET
jgi:hypothetical protein